MALSSWDRHDWLEASHLALQEAGIQLPAPNTFLR